MTDVTPRTPSRPLAWTDIVYELHDLLRDEAVPLYIVGGAVRDALLNRPIKDVDIATSGGGIRLARKIANRLDGAFFPLDTERDVGRALVERQEGRVMIDVAGFRGDGLLADLTDRDFTLNALAVDLRGDLSLLIDPLGGEQDAINRVIRRCNPNSLAHDPIRALRAVRQSVQLNGRIEPETLRDVRATGARILNTSPERVRDEFMKMLALSKPATALRILDAVGLLEIIVPEIKPLHGLSQDPPHVFDGWTHTLAVVENLMRILAAISPARTDDTAAQFSLGIMVMQLDRYRARLQAHLTTSWADERPHQALLMLAALLHDIGKPLTDFPPETGCRRFSGHEGVGAEKAEERAIALRLSNAERQRLVAIVQNHMRVLWLNDPTPRAIHRFWRGLGDAGIDVCLLALADHLGTVGANFDQDTWLKLVETVGALLEAYYERRATVVEPPTLIDGSQLMKALGLRPGRQVGELLDLIREAQAAGEVQSADEALNLARAHLNGKR